MNAPTHKNIMSLGCSCINRFEIQHYVANDKPHTKIKTGLFDWSIATPRSTLQLLKAVRSHEALSILTDRRNYGLEGGRLKNNAFECFYFWHDNGAEALRDDVSFARFSSKVSHLLSNFTDHTNNVHILWSNLQPNLQPTVQTLTIGWNPFRLTEELYQELRAEAEKVFHHPSFSFIGRREDIDSNLFHQRDVVLMELERNKDYTGADRHYAAIFQSLR